MIEIGSGANYRIAADAMKNRLHFWFFGDLMREGDNPQFRDHTEEAIRRLNPGFTVIGDMAELKMLGLPDMAQELQVRLLNAGVARVASVWSRESFSKLVIESAAQKAGDAYVEKRKAFTSRAQAEAWLDGKG